MFRIYFEFHSVGMFGAVNFAPCVPMERYTIHQIFLPTKCSSYVKVNAAHSRKKLASLYVELYF